MRINSSTLEEFEVFNITIYSNIYYSVYLIFKISCHTLICLGLTELL